MTEDNIASLRWHNVLSDVKLENERIEIYKERRRQRYIRAREHAIQTIAEQIHSTTDTLND
jgi:hypothetical protein